MRNPHYPNRNNTGPLKELIPSSELIVNNNPNYLIYLTSQEGISNIDLTLSSSELRPFCLKEIPEEYLSLSDHEIILLK